MFKAVTWVRAHGCLSATCTRMATQRHSSYGNPKGPLTDRVAVVTGSTNGIGLAIARRLAQDGAHVVVSSRKQQNVDNTVATLRGEGLSVTGTVCHVGKAEDRERLVSKALEHCGAVDFLVCNAGVNPLVGSTLGASEEVWDKILDVNLKSPALLLRQLLPHMEKRGSGVVILVSSIAAYTPMMELGFYNVSKTALLGLMKTLTLELAHKNIRVNCLVPGVIRTDFSKVIYEHDTILWNLMKKLFKVQRQEGIYASWIGQPEDCAGIVSFLCSPEASYINGESIAVAGFSPRL